MPPREIVVSLRGVQKDYHGLRPLRIQRLELRQGTSMAILGIDDAGAEVLTSLITAAAIPDEGEVDIFGTSTRAIADADHWLRELDRFGVLSERVVLLDQFSVEQNLALPLSLELDALPSAVQSRVAEIAVEVGTDTSGPVPARGSSPARGAAAPSSGEGAGPESTSPDRRTPQCSAVVPGAAGVRRRFVPHRVAPRPREPCADRRSDICSRGCGGSGRAPARDRAIDAVWGMAPLVFRRGRYFRAVTPRPVSAPWRRDRISPRAPERRDPRVVSTVPEHTATH